MRRHDFKVKWQFVVVGLVVVLGAAYLARRALLHIERYRFIRQNVGFPQAYIQPTPPTDASVADLPEAMRTEIYGFSFLLPSKVRAQREISGEGVVLILEDGRQLIVLKPDSLGADSSYASMKESQQTLLQNAFDVDAAAPNYGWFHAVFQATPNDVGFFRIGGRNVMTQLLLNSKQQEFSMHAKHVYEIAGDAARGFEIGVPGDAADAISLRLFDEQDHQLQMWLQRSSGGKDWTQPEINALVASLQKK